MFFWFFVFNAGCGRAFLSSLPADEQCFYALVGTVSSLLVFWYHFLSLSLTKLLSVGEPDDYIGG